MKRRDFLRNSLSLSLAPLVLNRLAVQSFATPEMLSLLNCQGVDERVLVVLFLKGGNDGLNTIIPVNQYDTYIGHRSTIGLPETGTGAFVNLDQTLGIDDQIGIHPIMSSFKSMYDAGNANIIQATGYPNSNGSHFKSTDLWLSGGDGTAANYNISSGWMGRFLDAVYPGLYGSPTLDNPDPLGIQLGDRKPSLGYHNHESEFIASNLSQQNPGGLYDAVQSIGTPAHTNVPASDFGEQIAHIMAVENSTNAYAERITNVFNTGTNSSVSYPNTDLGNQLQTVAKLMSGGSKTKVFLVHVSGFDTHASQVVAGATHTGTHANLLANVFDSVKAFHDDLGNLGLGDKVMTASFSEFSRRVTQNGSTGTDHGNYGPMFLFGAGVQAGVIGTNSNIANINGSGYLNSDELQNDYRSVFKTLIQDWLGGSESTVQASYFDGFDKITGLVKTAYNVDPGCYFNTFINQIVVRAKVLMEGFVEDGTGNMRTDLKQKNLLPLDQPFNVAPYNYTETESVTTIPVDVADWVLLELRDSNDVNTVVSRKAAFVQADGTLVDLDGSSDLVFRNTTSGEYYLAVFHKSHIAVVSSTTINSASTDVYDFTSAESMAMGTQQLKELPSGGFAMFAGDFNSSGINDDTDYNNWKSKAANVEEYLSVDADGNGVVNNQDFNLWKRNKNKSGHSSIQQ